MIGNVETNATRAIGRDIAGPEPQQKQRRISEARDRRADADQRQQDIFGAPRAAHQDADGHADQGREREAGRQPRQRIERVMRQHAADRQPREHRRNGFQRWEEPRRKQPGMRHHLPDRADHDEGEQVAPHAAQCAILAR